MHDHRGEGDDKPDHDDLNDDEIIVESISRHIPKKTRKSILARIIQARMQDIFELAAIEIKNSQIYDQLHAGVVITGGGSLVKGTKELAEEILKMEVNLGIPTGLSGGLIKEVESPIFATGVGLILHKMKLMNEPDYIHIFNGEGPHRKLNTKNLLSKIKAWFDNL